MMSDTNANTRSGAVAPEITVKFPTLVATAGFACVA
jgi:hypothetical protein